MRRSSSLRNKFFDSLKLVEKRMKSESSSPPKALQEMKFALTDPLSSPIFLNFDQAIDNSDSISALRESEPPPEFMSNSHDFPPTCKGPSQLSPAENQSTVCGAKIDDLDDILLLMQLLGLSEHENQEEQPAGELDFIKFGCDNGFLGKIAGVKGPKCRKEVERLEGWIKHFLNNCDFRGRRERFRLAHLLLGKAVSVAEATNGCFGSEFPSTIDEFLQSDPPTD